MARQILQTIPKYPNCVVFNNFGFKHEYAVDCVTKEEIFAAAFMKLPKGWHKIIAIDEIGAIFPSRGFSQWPPAADIIFGQGRKLYLELIWTTQHWRLVDANVRRVTSKVSHCSGFVSKRLTPKGELPVETRPRFFRERVFLSPNPDSAELPPKCHHNEWHRFDQRAADSYDTMALIDHAARLIDDQLTQLAIGPAMLAALELVNNGDAADELSTDSG